MKVKVLYFASAREISGGKEESLALPEGASVSDLSEAICELHPAMRGLSRSARFSVNLELVEPGRTLRESDVVGVLPPVAGG